VVRTRACAKHKAAIAAAQRPNALRAAFSRAVAGCGVSVDKLNRVPCALGGKDGKPDEGSASSPGGAAVPTVDRIRPCMDRAG
jgi:hypothetical protein